MAKLWERKLINGTALFDDVPENRKGEVRQLLDRDGYRLNEDGTVSRKDA